MKSKSVVFFLFLFPFLTFAQLQKLEPVSGSSCRGLDILNDTLVLMSGTNGQIIIHKSGVWKNYVPEQAKDLDFRDAQIVNDSVGYVLTAGSPALLYKVNINTGQYQLIFEDKRENIFLDGLSFWNDNSGIMYGDPIDGKMTCFLIQNDSVLPLDNLPLPLSGEAGFAASGTGVVTLHDSLVWIATGGGDRARVFFSENKGTKWESYDTPLISGEGMGIFSMTFWNEREGVVVGGSYIDSTSVDRNCAVTNDGGETWQLIDKQQPIGYRSCVASNHDGSLLVACGRTGIDYSLDKGQTWKKYSDEGYYSVVISEKYAWFSGRKGKFARAAIKDFK